MSSDNLEVTQQKVLELCHDLRDKGNEDDSYERALRERIRKHLRLVLCDVIILRKTCDDTMLDG